VPRPGNVIKGCGCVFAPVYGNQPKLVEITAWEVRTYSLLSQTLCPPNSPDLNTVTTPSGVLFTLQQTVYHHHEPVSRRLQLTTYRYDTSWQWRHHTSGRCAWPRGYFRACFRVSILGSQCNSTSTKSPVSAFSDQTSEASSTARQTWRKLPVLSSLRSFWANSTTAMQFWSVCPNPPLYHFSGHRMQRPYTGGMSCTTRSRDKYTETVTLVSTGRPIHFRINFKRCLLMHQIHNSRAPSYLTNSHRQFTVATSVRQQCSIRTTPYAIKPALCNELSLMLLQQPTTVVATDDQHRLFRATFEIEDTSFLSGVLIYF